MTDLWYDLVSGGHQVYNIGQNIQKKEASVYKPYHSTLHSILKSDYKGIMFHWIVPRMAWTILPSLPPLKC